MSSLSSTDKAVVLIVEDEVILRMAAVCFVEEAGFEAVEAGNADEAIRLLESRSDVRLLFTDIDMPFGSMNGLKLARAVRHRWPPIMIIVASGHQVPAKDDMPAGSKFFRKPYDQDHMVSAMQGMLNAA